MTNIIYKWDNFSSISLEINNDIKNSWDKLNNSFVNQSFLSSYSVLSALKIFGSGKERLLIAYEDNNIVAMFLISPAGKFQWKTFQPSQIPLGVWVIAKDANLENLARSLLRGPIGFCLALSFTQIDPLNTGRSINTSDSRIIDYIDTGWIDIKGNFEEYWNARGKNLRTNLRKQRAKLILENAKLSLQVIKKTDQMAKAVEQFGQLESQGWKAQTKTAIHSDNRQGKFYRRLLEQASLVGEAVVYKYLINEKVVAMNLCLQRQGTLVVLKTSYDESYKSYSPAFLLRETELQLFFKEGDIKRIEYFGRLMDWHTKFTDKRRTLHHLTIYRWPLFKKLADTRRGKLQEMVSQS